MTDRKPWQRPGFIVATAVILAAIILGIVALVRSGMSSPEQTDAPTPSTAATTASPTPSATTEPSDLSACGLEAIDLDGTLDAAPETDWTYVGVTAMPSVSGHGPGSVSPAGVRTCFAHTPTGAVLALANFLTQVNSPELQQEALREFTAQGAGYDEAVNAGPTSSQPADLSVVGFRVLSYAGDEALVDIAMRVVTGGQQAYVSVRAPMLWQNGDWRYVPGADGQGQYPSVVLPSIGDYVVWSAS